MIKVINYNKKYKIDWNNFLHNSNIDNFIFDREFMEYHKKKFKDNSLIFKKNRNIAALLPANISDNILYSHLGLTFGGFIVNSKLNFSDYQEIIDAFFEYCKKKKFKKIIIRQIPFIHKLSYNNIDECIIWGKNSKILHREPNSVIFLENIKFPWSTLKRKMKISRLNNILYKSECNDFLLSSFFKILEQNLKTKYNKKPTHKLTELKYLFKKFPKNIKLYTAIKNNEVIGGIVLFINNKTLHTQYIASNDTGRKNNIIDCIIYNIINEYIKIKKFLSLGISSENKGKKINKSLLNFKSKLRSQLVLNDTIEIKL